MFLHDADYISGLKITEVILCSFHRISVCSITNDIYFDQMIEVVFYLFPFLIFCGGEAMQNPISEQTFNLYVSVLTHGFLFYSRDYNSLLSLF